MGIDNLQNGLSNVGTLLSNPLVAGAVGGGAGLVVGSVVTGAIVSNSKKKKRKTKSKSRKSTKHRSRSKRRDWRYISKEKHEVAYQKKRKRLGKKTRGKKYKTKTSKSYSRRGVHYTKKGQPYILLKSGKARFIKKSRRKN